MSRPTLLDLFCGAGGAARGYQLAGFHVTGVDHWPQPRYAGDTFIQADALEYVTAHGREYDCIHASPPCQRYTVARHHPQKVRRQHPDLVGLTRELLPASGVPWVIENVIGAPMRRSLMLCGSMFGLAVRRHRLFESPYLLLAPGPCRHPKEAKYLAGRSRHAGRPIHSTVVMVYGKGGSRGHVGQWKAAMGIDWMTLAELAQAIPPVYAEFVGLQLLNALQGEYAC